MNTTQTRRYRKQSGRRPYNAAPSNGKRSRGNASASSSRSGGPRRSSNGPRRQKKLPTFDPSQFINKNPKEVVLETFEPVHKFADFGLDNRLLTALKALNITAPTPIQDQIIPLALEGRDVIGLAATGTGKTAAFLLPLIERTKLKQTNQTLILTPTRELALQIEAELKKLTTQFHFYSTVCVGGTPIGPQIRGLKKRNHFVIGTPGRIMDLMERNVFKTEFVDTVVLDEADRMLDMGFIHDMRKILSTVPRDHHTLFFSATMDDKTKALINDFMTNPALISVKKKDVTDSIAQDVVPYVAQSKFETLQSLLAKPEMTRVIIFGAMKHSVEKLAQELSRHGIAAESIHGNKSHGQRQRSLTRFKSGHARVLVATDVAARGIHVNNVSHVINYDLPNTFEDYVHRIGRTGRGSQMGQALTFVPTR